jgi:hypothetical protein
VRLKSLLATLGLVAAGAVVSAPAAEAAPTCSLLIQSRVAIRYQAEFTQVFLGSNCYYYGVHRAQWGGYHPTRGRQQSFSYEGTTSAPWTIGGNESLGRWTWQPEGAWTEDGTPVYQYGPYYTDIRLASYARVVLTRIGTKINVKTTAMRSWVGGGKFIGWAGARGQIQYRTPGTTAWKGLKEVYSYSNGTYSYTYTTSARREYRVVIRDVPTIWGSTSPVIER